MQLLKLIALLCGSSVALHVSAQRADAPTTTDPARVEACVGQRSSEANDELNRVAREFSRLGSLKEAMDRVGYRAASSESLYVKGPRDDAAIREIIDDRDCAATTDRQFNEVGVYRNRSETWIVFAVRALPRPAVEDSAAIAARVLEIVNAARSGSRRCGDLRLDAAPPLVLSQVLTEAASRHASDMALQGALDHRGSDGSEPAERVLRAGYRWRATGENIAAGQSTADAVVAAWLDSAGHCANIMGPQYTEMGVGFGLAPAREPAIYWTQVFARPR